jgi:hypothetical protein
MCLASAVNDGQDALMEASNISWKPDFEKLFRDGCGRYEQGHREVATFFSGQESQWLASIGCKPQELFDFIEDHINYGEPDLETAFRVAALRERYLKEVQKGVISEQIIPAADLPAKTDAMDGVVWFPRLLAKARAKLRGQLDQPTMYGCAGDRPFLASHGHTLDSFLEVVWKLGEDDSAILSALRSGRQKD